MAKKTYEYKPYEKSEAVKRAEAERDSKSTYKDSDVLLANRDALSKQEAAKPTDWTGGKYGQAMDDALNAYKNRENFKYDLNADALYQQYKNQYMTQGKLAMQDTIGQASAMTGGYGNSYATAAGNQMYQSYLQGLNDKVPELYQLALDKYNQEGDKMLNEYSLLSNQYATEYGEHRNTLSDWQNEVARLQDKVYNQENLDYNKFSADRDYYASIADQLYNREYGEYSDAWNRDFNTYQQGVAEEQWNKQYALNKKSADQSATISALRNQLSTIDAGTVSYEDLSRIKNKINTFIEKKDESGFNDFLNKEVEKGTITKAYAIELAEEYGDQVKRPTFEDVRGNPFGKLQKAITESKM